MGQVRCMRIGQHQSLAGGIKLLILALHRLDSLKMRNPTCLEIVFRNGNHKRCQECDKRGSPTFTGSVPEDAKAQTSGLFQINASSILALLLHAFVSFMRSRILSMCRGAISSVQLAKAKRQFESTLLETNELRKWRLWTVFMYFQTGQRIKALNLCVLGWVSLGISPPASGFAR